MPYPCISCGKSVTSRQEALQCETCNQWNHRKCGTGISRQLYRRLVRGEEDLDWWCSKCDVPDGIEPDHDSLLQEEMRQDDVPYADDTAGNTESTLQENDMDDTDQPVPTVELEENDTDDTDQPVPTVELEENDTDDTDQPVPTVELEESVEERTITEEDMEVDNDEPVFSIVDSGTQRGARKLTDSRGYTFTFKRQLKATTYWACSVRSKSLHCHATIIQKGDSFQEGKQRHNHPAKPGLDVAVKITAQVKVTAKQQIRDSARSVVETVMRESADVDVPEASRPNEQTLIRIANRARETLRPKDPQDLDFELNETFLPGQFIRGDVQHDGERHIILASRDQLSLLADSKVWFMDGTFKVVRRPFYQLLSVHSFLRSGPTVKQVPLAFVLMSRRRKSDYRADVAGS